ncbi:MAG: UbiA family prenyltransferase [Bryobacteraceae bacterium]|nr:UbiA family prenyltransferase [Bryobacteraceae bacterium]MDW8377603.1 UbiA family prenyltransferase [Bryobacterales bacterium]
MVKARETDVEKRQPQRQFRAALRLLRPEQWPKNLLVFLPLMMSHRVGELSLLISSAGAAVAFTFVAAAGYVWNDWLDRKADAFHYRKQERALAAGEISGTTALWLALACLVAGISAGYLVETRLLPLLGGYFAASALYSWILKRLAFVDVAVVACFYGARVYAGHLATGIELSQALIGFCLACFFSLAMLKRQSEVSMLSGAALHENRRRYRPHHRPWMAALGLGAAAAGVVVVAVYTEGEMARTLYRRPQLLWLLCPLLMLWFIRAWWLASQGRMVDDPLAFALHDRWTWAVVAAMACLWLAAW